MKHVNDLYRAILTALGVKVNEKSMLSYMDVPCMVDKKRLCLPTPDVLGASDWGNVIAFHPLAENTLRGESKVFKHLRNLTLVRLTEVCTFLMETLIRLAAETDNHKLLTPAQVSRLSSLEKADNKTLDFLMELRNKIKIEGEYRLVNIYMKRNGELDGKTYSRVAVVTFPLYDALCSTDEKVFGVANMRKTIDRVVLRNLFELILPKIKEPNGYSYGSNSQIAPYFDALMQAYANIMRDLNPVTWEFRKYLKDTPDLHQNLEFMECFDNLAFYRGQIPVLNGNDGEIAAVGIEQAKEEAAKSVSAPASSIAAPPASIVSSSPEKAIEAPTASTAPKVAPPAPLAPPVAHYNGYPQYPQAVTYPNPPQVIYPAAHAPFPAQQGAFPAVQGQPQQPNMQAYGADLSRIKPIGAPAEAAKPTLGNRGGTMTDPIEWANMVNAVRSGVNPYGVPPVTSQGYVAPQAQYGYAPQPTYGQPVAQQVQTHGYPQAMPQGYAPPQFNGFGQRY